MVEKKLVARTLDSTTSLPRHTKDNSKWKWIRLPFLNTLSFELNRILEPLGFRPAFYNPLTIRSQLSRIKDPVPTFQKSGVYKLQCNECSALYIGETERQLSTRVQEHLDDVTSTKPNKSAFSAHLAQSGHTFDIDQAELLHCESSFRKRLAPERY